MLHGECAGCFDKCGKYLRNELDGYTVGGEHKQGSGPALAVPDKDQNPAQLIMWLYCFCMAYSKSHKLIAVLLISCLF